MSASELAKAIDRRAQAASESRWLAVGIVTATGTTYSISLDGATLTGLRKARGYTTPAVGDVVLVGIVRGSTSVSHILIDAIA